MPARSAVLEDFFFHVVSGPSDYILGLNAAPSDMKHYNAMTLCPDPHTCLNLNLPKPDHPNDPAWGQGDLNAAILLVQHTR